MYSNANLYRGGASGSQFIEGSLARTSKDFIFLLLLKDTALGVVIFYA